MQKFNIKRKWFILIFTALIITAFLFVWWMSSSNFEGSYREITQQYYGVVAGQVVSELESSIKYGKSLDSFYNISGIFGKLTALLPAHVKAVILNGKGEVLYTSFAGEANGNDYAKALQNPLVAAKLKNMPEGQSYAALVEGSYEIMILPISGKNNTVIGSFTLIYPVTAVSDELQPQHMENLRLSVLVLVIPLLALIIFLCFAPVADEPGKGEKKTAEKGERWQNVRRELIYLVPALIVMLGIGVQSTIMYNHYQVKYKSAISEGARGILAYIENSITSMHHKGVSYDKMSGLSDYLTAKARNTPIIWNIRIYNTIADTEDALERENQWVISAPLAPEMKGDKLQVEIQISQEYMKNKMFNMFLVFLVTIIVSGVVIYELMRLPDIMLFRKGKQFNMGTELQYEKVTVSLRIISFIAFMGMYTSMPFSAILMRQWDAKLFGLSTDMTASLPMTLELVAIMLFSMVFARLFGRTGLMPFLLASGIFIIAGNALSGTASGPLQIIFFRVICGIGFAGIKHVMNNMISSSSGDSTRTGLHIAGMNAGLLGGIMCGGSLGAVIANSMGISFTYMFTAGILVVFAAVTLYITPWKLMRQNMLAAAPLQGKAPRGGTLGLLLKGKVLKYLVMVTLPLNIGLMFIVAFVPGYVQKMSLPVILISYGYIVNGLLGIYLGPLMVKLLAGSLSRSANVAVMLALGGIAILMFGIYPSVGVILLSTALMGLFDGFGSPVSTDYFIQMPEIKDKMGVSSSLTVLGVVGNATQMLSPMLYGGLMMVTVTAGVNALLILGAVYLAFAVVFNINGLKLRGRRRQYPM